MSKISAIANKFIALDEKDEGVVSQALFFVPYVVWFASRILFTYSSYASFLPAGLTAAMIRDVCVGVLIVREILFGKWDRLSFFGLMTFVFMAIACYLGHWIIIIEGAYFIFAARNIPFRRIALVSAVVMACCVSIVIASAFAGVIPDQLGTSETRGVRHFLGFIHPNTGPAFALFLLLLYMYCRNSKYGVIDAGVSFAIAFILYALTGSRTSLIIMAFAIACGLALRYMPNKVLESMPMKVISMSVFAVCALVSVLLAITYDPANPFFAGVDHLLSGRLAIAHNALLENGVPIFGQTVIGVNEATISLSFGNEITRPNYAVDNGYIKTIVYCGVAFFVVTILMSIAVGKRAHDFKEYYIVLAIVCTAIYGISESVWLYLYFNPFLLLVGSLFATDKQKAWSKS